MLDAELARNIKNLEIKTRQFVNSVCSGKYHSVFKGDGICFSEVQAYYPGDDCRRIDWRVTAKMGTPYLKKYDEERNLTVILMVDVSASGQFGSVSSTKRDVAAKLASVLGFSAQNNGDKVGLLLFTDCVEAYIPAKRSKKHMFTLLQKIYTLQPRQSQTNIQYALQFISKVIKKKAIIFLISDFIDDGYEDALKVCARYHEVIPIVLEDPKEQTLPKAGIVAIEDNETGEHVFINTYSKSIRKKFHNIMLAKRLERQRYFRYAKCRPININITKPFFKIIDHYFTQRSQPS